MCYPIIWDDCENMQSVSCFWTLIHKGKDIFQIERKTETSEFHGVSECEYRFVQYCILKAIFFRVMELFHVIVFN